MATYSRRVIRVLAEGDAAVVFVKASPSASGGVAGSKYYNFATELWGSAFDASQHVRRCDKPDSLMATSINAFAVPTAVANDPTTAAVVVLTKPDGSIASILTIIDNPFLAAAAGNFPVAPGV